MSDGDADKKRLPLLTNSSMTMFRRCPREYYFRYVLHRRSTVKSEALRFGSFFHVGLNAWWRVNGNSVAKLGAALEAIDSRAKENPVDADPFELVKAEELLVGYTVRWGHEPYYTMAVELQFRIPLSPQFDLGGAVDAIARRARHPTAHGSYDTFHNVEHKTTSKDISVTSDYWNRIISLDSQVSAYMSAARALGYEPRDTIYDVIRKPYTIPLKATPLEARKYTIPTAKAPVPRLYANQRETDETPEEYRARLNVEISSNPDKYYNRMSVVRLEKEDEEHARDVLQTAEMIRFAEQRNAWPRSPSACERYNAMCSYVDVCSGNASIADSRFETKKPHEELNDE